MSYAKAIYEIIKNCPDCSLVNLLSKISDSFGQSYELQNFLLNPAFSYSLKERILGEIFPELRKHQFKDIFNFLRLLIKKQKFGLIQEIVDKLRQLINQKEQIEEVRVKTYFDLSKASQEKIKKFLRREVKDKNFIIYSQVCKETLGGFVLETKDFLFDQSLKNKFLKFKEFLTSSR